MEHQETVTRLEVPAGKAAPTFFVNGERPNSLKAMLRAQEVETESEPLLLEQTSADSAALDPLIQGLVNRLPRPATVWSLPDRGKWLRAAAVIFTLMYNLEEGESDEQSLGA